MLKLCKQVGYSGKLMPNAHPVFKVEGQGHCKVRGEKIGPHISRNTVDLNLKHIACRYGMVGGYAHTIFDLDLRKETSRCHSNGNIHHRSYLTNYNRSEIEDMHIGTVWWEADAQRYS